MNKMLQKCDFPNIAVISVLSQLPRSFPLKGLRRGHKSKVQGLGF